MLRAVALMLVASSVLGQERVSHALGDFEYRTAANGVLIAAPHGTFDANTAPLVLDAAGRMGAGYLVARRFTVDKIRLNVNRPTEGAFLACAQEARTGRAKEAYDVYEGLLAKAAVQRPLQLYVEVHGNSNPLTARNIELAALGISAAHARAVKEEFPRLLARVRQRVAGFPELGLLMEPVDRLTYTAGCAKRIGAFAGPLVTRGLHFEFPRSAREPATIQGAAMLVAEIARRVAEP